MKTTLIGTLPPIKGLSPYCTELLKALSKQVNVEFIGFKSLYPDFLYPGGTTSMDNGYLITNFSNTKIRTILTYYNPLSWIWAGLTLKGKVVHAQWWAHVLAPIYFTVLILAKIRGKKIIITVHNVLPHEKNFFSHFLNSAILKLGDSFIAHTEKNKTSLSKIYNIDPKKITMIPHGTLEPIPITGVSKEEARKRIGILQNNKVILHFGNIRDYKGLDVLLEALGYVVSEKSNVTLLIAGKSWGSFQKYDEIIEKNNLKEYVIKKLHFINPSEVEYYFSAADLVALPYKYFDAQSGVAALALPFGKPLIVTNTGGLPDFVKDERAIAIVNDPRDLASKITRILTDENLLAKLCRDSRDIAKDSPWDEIAQRTVQVYLGG